jgi:hypothetical protein
MKDKLVNDEKIAMIEFDKAWEEFFKNKPRPRNNKEDRNQQEKFHHWYNNVRKQSDTGKTPKEMGKRIMEFSWDDSEEYDYYIPLNELLVPETKEVTKIRAIAGKKVEEYGNVFFPIESNIAEYFLGNRHIKDADLKKALINFIKNPFKEFDYSKFPIENEIQFGASIGAQNKKISLHELKLIVDFLILSIENRNYIPGERGYLTWVCAFLGYLDENSIKEIEDMYRFMGSFANIPNKQIDQMIMTLQPGKNAVKLSKLDKAKCNSLKW